MKRNLSKKLAFFMVLALIVTTITIPKFAKAAAPTLSATQQTLTGVGKTYKLTVKNQVKGCTYTWLSSNTKVTTVTSSNGTGTVTSVGKGKSKITCTIKYSNGAQRKLNCTVTVLVPATAVKISNANIVNNVHTIQMGSTYDFNRTLTPTGSSDRTYFTVEPEGYATVSAAGVVTPIKEGTFTLVATAAADRQAAVTSVVKDRVLIQIVPKSAAVTSVELGGASEIIINFSTPINADTVVDASTGKLTSNVVIAAGKDTTGKAAEDYGTLTGSLSADGKVLSIKASNKFNGVYTVNVTSAVLSKDGTALTAYAKSHNFADTIPPTYVGSVIDDSGVRCVINFNEAIDISNMTIPGVKSASTTILSSLEATTLSNPKNYTLSTDRKSLTIDMSYLGLPTTTKTYTVDFQGIKDMAGNISNTNFINSYVYYDTTPKAQARVVNIKRSAYDKVTVVFDRSIQPYGTGILSVNSTSVYNGTIDKTNSKLVNYTLPASIAALTGNQTVSVVGWNAYNVTSTDTTANSPITRVVNFTPDAVAPSIASAKLTNANGVYTLTLVYNKKVLLAIPSGILAAKVTTSSDDIYNSNINYTATLDADGKTVNLSLDSKQMTLSGKYDFTITKGIVKDAYFNMSEATTVSVASSATAETVLPKPTSIVQSTKDASVIVITFANKLDLASATAITSYRVAGATVSKAEVESNTNTLAIVNLTLSSGSIPYDSNYLVTITGVKGYNNTFNALTNYTQTIPLKENVSPCVVGSGKLNTNGSITVTFNEAIIGTANFDVYQNGVLISNNTFSTFNASDKTLTIYGFANNGTTGITLVPKVTNAITDLNGNPAVVPSTIYVY
ncbi:MAG TPA: Ig-like domain-containing protein [Lachnospiraceae bacterium]|nr:Ig-like domain-containing protein [Lachnospiraceae bacterium]